MHKKLPWNGFIYDNPEAFASKSIELYTNENTWSGAQQNGIKIIGVNPENETKVLGLSTRMSEGTFLDSKLAYPIVVGEKLAEELHLKLNSKVQLNFTNPNTSQISKTFKVCGIYNIGDDVFEGYNVFVPLSKIEKLTGEHLIHEIVIKTSEDPNSTAIALQAQNPSHQIQSWGKRNPEIAYMIEMMDTTLFILMFIIVFALLFGIINTVTMSILERKREIGVMLAIGMNKYRIRGMIMFESLIYGLIGAPVGVFLGDLTMMYYGNYGFDLSAFGEGMKAFYDKMLPNEVNKFFNKKAWGKAKVGEIEISQGNELYSITNKITGQSIGGGYLKTEAQAKVDKEPGR